LGLLSLPAIIPTPIQYQYPMKKIILTALLVVIAAAANAQTDTTIVNTTAIVLSGKAYLKTVTTHTNFKLITGEMIVRAKRDKSEDYEEKELRRLEKQSLEKKTKKNEEIKLIKQALATANVEIIATTEEEDKELKRLRDEAKKEKVKPIR
jgi:hypothetical protein